MKKCSCGQHYMYDDDEMCSYCFAAKFGHSQVVKPSHKDIVYAETFTFTNERCFYGKQGYKAYNSEMEFVGIVFMTDDKRSPSHGCAELHFFDKYKLRYGEYHRIESHGGKLPWKVLCERLNKNNMYECYVD